MLLDALREEHKPSGITETILVDKMAQAVWLTKRAVVLQHITFNHQMPGCDDPKQLAEIDAVFVTVEPRGGSQIPTGRPFLYALLRKEANHP